MSSFVIFILTVSQIIADIYRAVIMEFIKCGYEKLPVTNVESTFDEKESIGLIFMLRIFKKQIYE